MKYPVFMIALACCFMACGSARNTTGGKPRASSSPSSSPEFLDISIDQESSSNSHRISAYKGNKSGKYVSSAAPDIEKVSAVPFKYAILMDVPVEEVANDPSIPFIEEWYGTPYRLGGTTKSGVDCSAFTLYFASSIYGLSLPRTSREQHGATLPVSRSDLQQGDLVFFSTGRRKTVTHVGVYLRNNKFVHASTSSGVMISDLDESYWKPRYLGAGRMNGLSSSK